MSKITAFESLTLDGVMQAPGRPDEDTRGGFAHGGWAPPYFDDVMAGASAENMGETGGLLLGRRTYEDFHAFWPNQTDNPFTEVLNNTRKYVASTTLQEPLPWENSTLLGTDVPAAVAELRARPGKGIVVLGSGELVRSLVPRGLIDEYVLLIHPIVLGLGVRLFADDMHADLTLVDVKPTTTGVLIATYRPQWPAG
jgi:dihydrofolate reductase